MLDLLADHSTHIRIRVVDVIPIFLWIVAIVLLVIETADGHHGEIGRWGLLTGMLALAGTFWSIATWMVEVIRLEYEITTLRRLPLNRAKDGSA